MAARGGEMSYAHMKQTHKEAQVSVACMHNYGRNGQRERWYSLKKTLQVFVCGTHVIVLQTHSLIVCGLRMERAKQLLVSNTCFWGVTSAGKKRKLKYEEIRHKSKNISLA